MSVTKAEIAQWMIDQVQSNGYLDQADAVQWIEEKFGPEWIYENENGNPAIDQRLLDEFRRMRSERITWDGSDKSWSFD